MTPDETLEKFLEMFDGKVYDPEQQPALFEHQIKLFKWVLLKESENREIVKKEPENG